MKKQLCEAGEMGRSEHLCSRRRSGQLPAPSWWLPSIHTNAEDLMLPFGSVSVRSSCAAHACRQTLKHT